MRCSISLHSSHDCGSFFPDGSCSRVIFTSPLHTLSGICVHCSGEIASWTSHYENAILGIPFLPLFFSDTHDDNNHCIPTRSALILERKDSFVSLLTNLNDKNNMAAIPLYSSIMSVASSSWHLFEGSRGFQTSRLPYLAFLAPASFSYLPSLAFFRTRHI